jgi:subtilisin family serine protease
MQTILIYANRRQRKQLAKQGVTFLAEYDDYVLATVTPEQTAALRSQGFEVEVKEQEPAVAVRGRSVALTPATRDVCAAAESVAPQGPPPETFGPGPHYYLVQFVGPIKPEWLADIQAHGATLQEPTPPYGYIVGLETASYNWLTTEASYVRWVGHYSAELRLAPDLTERITADPFLARSRVIGQHDGAGEKTPDVERVPTTFTVKFFESDDLEQALPAIRGLGGAPGAHTSGATLITVSFAPDQPDLATKVERIAHLHGVRSVEAYALRQLYNNVAIGLMGAEEVIRPNPSGSGLSGRGEIVAVADSGLDTGKPDAIHPDFAGRVTAIFSWPVAADWSTIVTNVGGDDGSADARSGHGTHVAGSVCGNGATALAAQEPAIRGLAAEARLVFQAVEQTLQYTDAYKREYYRQNRRYPPPYGLAGLPVDLRQVFQQAYYAGARIHNNSWGGGDPGAYDDYAEAVDRFTWEHKDFLILFAAGNDGIDGDRDGMVDAGSVTPPGTAKNCLTVGATESQRSQGGYQLTYGQLWGSDFPVNPLRNDKPSDSPVHVAAFSSRGPAKDGRIKPDLAAPGTNIASTRSQALDSGVQGWGAYPRPRNRYMFDGGTSMATPLTTGAAAVVRQYLRQIKRRARPSAALIKATLIHAAQYQPDPRYGGLAGRINDFAQGWGRLNLASVLKPAAPVKVAWYEHQKGLNTGESFRFYVTVTDASTPLAFTLVWSDFPSAAGHYPNLVNDLDLVVTAPSGAVCYGNAGGPGGQPDRLNNVERVVIPKPELGRYQVRVRGTNVPHGPQDSALVWSGGIV